MKIQFSIESKDVSKSKIEFDAEYKTLYCVKSLLDSLHEKWFEEKEKRLQEIKKKREEFYAKRRGKNVIKFGKTGYSNETLYNPYRNGWLPY